MIIFYSAFLSALSALSFSLAIRPILSSKINKLFVVRVLLFFAAIHCAHYAYIVTQVFEGSHYFWAIKLLNVLALLSCGFGYAVMYELGLSKIKRHYLKRIVHNV